MNPIDQIRTEEKKYHDFCYENYKLFESGSWLYKPVKTVIDLLSQFENYDCLDVFDLGSGIGRNSIPIAKSMQNKTGRVVCVDLLESAILKLLDYSKEYEVQHLIEAELSKIENFPIQSNEYDLIIAVSSLEHVSSEGALERIMSEMISGTKRDGVNCIIIGSNMREITMETNMELIPMFEVNIPTDRMLNLLDRHYDGWEIQKRLVKPLEYEIVRDGQPVKLTTDCITFVSKKIL
ncbi:class I SAM-dependent methyltransferase [Paenibacillus dokdonensis]|uniref:Class I SAM-dependent methyltransferase n=1 Tax=Paenibacillus dokdonensis TaxID=2567944 RepID=A0ABU6GKY3_9BACL|nr:class I SAM-dependent methyltransferase [Paenibacillus dokdonensis]MEC0240378.1 class I SAM-dependent methyltransferase [Paenibacillus dokdonensis]